MKKILVFLFFQSQTKIGLNFTLTACGIIGCVLSVYMSIGCWYHMGWCGQDKGVKNRNEPVPMVWTGSLQRNGSLPRQHGAKPVNTCILLHVHRETLNKNTNLKWLGDPDNDTN